MDFGSKLALLLVSGWEWLALRGLNVLAEVCDI